MEKITRIIKLLGLVIVVLLVMFIVYYWLERVDLIPTRMLTSVVSRFVNTPSYNDVISSSNDALVLEKLRIQKQEEALQVVRDDLLIRESQLNVRERDIVSQEEYIVRIKSELEEQKKNINRISERIENKSKGLRYNAQALVAMPPSNAVNILEGYDDNLLIDTLLMADTIADENGAVSLVPFWLSQMDAERAALIQEKLINR